jgi:hypothetical protein
MANGYYSSGTVSITSGAAALVGVGTAWASTVQVGDRFNRNGYSIPVSVVTDDTHITLAWNYPGTTLAGATYMIEYLPDLSRTIDLLSTLNTLLGTGGNLTALGGLSGLADKLSYFTGAGAMALTDLPALARQFLATAVSSNALWNVGIAASVGASALTVNLKQADGATDPTATKPAMIGFRSATLTSGAVSERTATAATTLTVPSGATLGQTSAVAGNLYVYAIDNAGAVELAIAGTDFGDSGRVSTTVMNTSSDDGATMYSTTARSNVAYRKIGILTATEATAGTWATAPSTVQVAPTGNLTVSEFIKTMLDDVDAATARTTLGLGTAATQNTGTSGATVPLLNAVNTWSAPQTMSNASNTNNIEVISTVENNNPGPFFSVYRNRAAGATNDQVGGIKSHATNAAGTKINLGVIDGQMTDATNASEDFIYRFQTVVNGTLATRLNIGGGLYHASATGTDKGLNTINFGAVYDDNVLLTCMALATEFRDSGTVDLAKWDAMVPNIDVPARIEQVPVMEEVEQPVLILERDDNGDLIQRTEVRTILAEATYFDPVWDTDGNGIDAIEMPLVEERIVPAQTIVREHHTARVFKAMLDAGFDPRDPEAYFAKMQADEALPGMPTQADWVHNALSVGENFSRKWLAMEMLAIVCNTMWIKLQEHDERISVLESA